MVGNSTGFKQRRFGGAGAALAAATALAGAFAVTSGGCGSRFHEVHYFKSIDGKTNEPINFYRVTVEGATAFSSSRYLSGYFDERAVDLYFSEFSQPDKGEFYGVVNEEDSGKVVPLGEAEDNRRLVMILSSNSDDIATAISSFAQSEAVTETLANIVGRDRLAQSGVADTRAAGDAQAGKALVTLGQTMLAEQAGATNGQVQANVLTYANALAEFLQSGTHFETLDDAKSFIRNFNAAQKGVGLP
jgi:hypothetical protein